MESLIIAILVVALFVVGFLCYWAGYDKGALVEYKDHVAREDEQIQRNLDLKLKVNELRTQLSEEEQRSTYWNAIMQQDGDYVE